VKRDLFAAQEGDILDERADHPLPVPIFDLRIAREPWQIRHERPHGRLLLGVETHPILGLLRLTFGLGLGRRPELRVRVRFKGIRHQAMIGVPAQVAPLREMAS